MVRHSIAWLVMIGELGIWWFPCGEPGTEKAMGAAISSHFNPQEKYLAEKKYLHIPSPSFRDDSAPRDSSGGPSGLWFVCWICAADWLVYLLAYKPQLRLLAAGGLHRTATVDLPGPAAAARRSEATQENGELFLHQNSVTVLHYLHIYASTVVYALCYWSQLGEKRVLTHGDERQASHRKEKRMA
jgi:hypothetical protein